jgi:uroporphyrinogen-III synthase
MSSEKSLAGKTIVVTRPLTQAQNILEQLETRLAKVIHFPVITICEAENMASAKQNLNNLDNYSIIIFISANAVHFAMSTAQELGINFKQSKLAAVGPATKAAVEGYGYKIDVVPSAGFTSEALLNDPVLQNISKENILIVRGHGGREHLRDTLQARGAQVTYAEVYQRQLPSHRNNINLSKLSQHNTTILLYSVESAQNLWSLCTPEERSWLQKLTFIVGSSRIAAATIQAGFAKNPIIAENPSDGGMLMALDALE